MSKAVLISIRPKWVEKIVSGEKTIEVRKTRPKLDTPFKCYIYCTLQGCNEFFELILGVMLPSGTVGNGGTEKARSSASSPVIGSSRSHTMAAGYGVRQMPPFPLRRAYLRQKL